VNAPRVELKKDGNMQPSGKACFRIESAHQSDAGFFVLFRSIIGKATF
jgi:hypothetical protein